MAATVTELQARLDSLQKQKDSGVARLAFDGRTVEYRDPKSIDNAIAVLTRTINSLNGVPPVRRLIVSAGKGL